MLPIMEIEVLKAVNKSKPAPDGRKKHDHAARTQDLTTAASPYTIIDDRYSE